MKKLIYSLAIAGLFAPALQARTLSVDEAKANAAAFTRAGMFKAPAMQGGLRLAATLNHDNIPTVYLFTNASGSGVVIASASDLTPAVLGYTDTPFDAAAIPPSMQALLDDYSAEIAWAEANGAKGVAMDAPAERAAI